MSTEQNAPRKLEVPKEWAARMALGEITLGEFVGLDRKTLYAVAETAHTLLTSGKLEQAESIYRGLVAADPFDSVFHCHLGAVLHKQGDLKSALQEYDESLKFNRVNVDALTGRGEIHLHSGQIKEALIDLSKAIELDPRGDRASTVRARAMMVAIGAMAKTVGGQA